MSPWLYDAEGKARTKRCLHKRIEHHSVNRKGMTESPSFFEDAFSSCGFTSSSATPYTMKDVSGNCCRCTIRLRLRFQIDSGSRRKHAGRTTRAHTPCRGHHSRGCRLSSLHTQAVIVYYCGRKVREVPIETDIESTVTEVGRC